MTEKFTSSQNVAKSGFNPPKNNRQTIHKKIADDQRRETHSFDTGFDGNELKRNDLKQEKSRKNEVKKGPLETGNEKGTFWTACSNCYYKYEFEKKYEESCLRCLNCSKPFHAVAAPPPDGLSVKAFYGKSHDVVDVSDSDDEKKEMEVKSEAGKVKAEGFNNGEGRVVKTKLKSVANFGFNPPQNKGQTIQKKIEDVQRRETRFLNTGFSGNELKKNDVKQGKRVKSGAKRDPLETGNEKGTFWTACSNCYYKYEYEKKYKNCSLRCQNCRKPFHAVAVKGYSGNSSIGAKKEIRRGDTGKRHDVVEVSDSDDENKEREVEAEDFNDGEGRVVMKRVKSVAMIRKKIAGRGMKSKKVGSGVADGCNEDELVDDDIFVDLRDIC